MGEVYLLETVAVVSRDEDKSLITDTELLELLNGGADGVVHLQEITKSAVVVELMHLLVNGSTLRHEEETLLLTTLGENLDGLDSHLLEAGNVGGGAVAAGGVVLELLEVVGVDVAVQPDGQVALGENTESTLADVDVVQGSLVQADSVALVGKLLVVVLALVGVLAGVELLGTATEEDVGAVLLGPGVVGDAIESLVNQRTVLGTATGVARQGNGSGIGKEGSGNGAPGTILSAVSESRLRGDN